MILNMRRFSSILLRAVPRHLSQSEHKKITKQQNAYFSGSFREPDLNRNRVEVEIISKEFIKPAAPTPEHSRIYEVSLLDQFSPNIYIPFVYFYRNDLINHRNKLISERRQLLKQSLSVTLTRFYPLAGRIKNSRHIECNDEGVYYVEAKVHNNLSDFLKHPENKSIHRLLPLDPYSKELFSFDYLAMVQVNEFSCGSIAIGLYTSHKILDGYSFATFFKAWAATARNSPNQICPSFIAPSILAPLPELIKHSTSLPIIPLRKTLTKRFVFHASSLATLKEQAESSRVLAVMGFLWKCAMGASKARSTTSHPKYFSLTTAVNLRERISPPMPPHCIGNIVWNTDPIQCSVDEDLELNSIVQLLRKSIDKINGDFIEEMKGEGFALNMEATLNEQNVFLLDKTNFKHMFMSSICNIGMYEADFGWGEPIWISHVLANIPILESFVMLMDTRFGNGIEAWVTLNEGDMAVFERDLELLSFASPDPSPLQLITEY